MAKLRMEPLGRPKTRKKKNYDMKGDEDGKLIDKEDQPVFGEDGRMAEH